MKRQGLREMRGFYDLEPISSSASEAVLQLQLASSVVELALKSTCL